MGFHGFELELEVFDMAFFSLSEGSLSGKSCQRMALKELRAWEHDNIRCSVLGLPPALRRCQVVLVVITAASTAWILLVVGISDNVL